MNWWYKWAPRRRGQLEEQLAKELRFHLDQHAGDLMARCCDPREARRQARLALGGPAQVKKGWRDVRGTRWLEDLWQDLGYALRTLRQKPGIAAVALWTHERSASGIAASSGQSRYHQFEVTPRSGV